MISDYSFGRIVVDGEPYDHDVIIYSDHIDRWWRRKGHELCIDDIKDIVEKGCEALIVGTGYYGSMNILSSTKKYLESMNVELLADRTADACQLYNRLSGSKKVVAALHLTC